MGTLTFGKYKGWSFEEVYQIDPDYLEWVEREAFSSPVRKAVSVFLRQKKEEDAQTKEVLLSAFHVIRKEHSFSFLKAFPYVFVDSHRNKVTFEFCTHPIYSKYGFNECFHSEDWDSLQISTVYDDGNEDLEEEEEEEVQRKPEALFSLPTAESSIWYAYKDNSGNDPLNTDPISLKEALVLLEKHYTKG